MSIQFLSSQQAAQEYIKSDYFEQMSHKEIIYRLYGLGGHFTYADTYNTKRSKLVKLYTSLTLDFTINERNIINFYFKQLLSLLNNKAPQIIPNKKHIGLIKINKGVDWDYPYTINHCIVIPTKFLNSLISTYQKFVDQLEITPQEMWNPIRPNYEEINRKNVILCHEMIHILQRNKTLYPQHNKIFNYIYKDIWGFRKINKSQLVFKNKYLNVITNPDGYNYEWIISLYNHETNFNQWFMPLLINNVNNKPTGILVELIEKEPGNFLVSGQSHWNYIETFKRYIYKFYGLKKQLYHPNEIIAHLLSNYIVMDDILTNAQYTFDYFNFYKILNKYFISSNFTPFKNR